MPTLAPSPKFVALDANGDPMPLALLYTYAPGTLTPKATYTNATGTIANSNPVQCDTAGRCDLWLSGLYKFELRHAGGALEWTVDYIGGGGSEIAASTFEGLPALGTPNRLQIVTNRQRGLWMENQDSTAWRPVSDTADARDWGVLPGASTLTTKLTAAINDCIAQGARLYLPKGTYTLPVDLTIDGLGLPFEWVGAGRGQTIITTSVTPTSGTAMVRLKNFVGLYLHNMSFDGAGFPASGHNRQVFAMQGCKQSVVERCEFYNAYAFGQLLEQNATGNVLCESVSFRDCWAHNNGNQGFSATGCADCDFTHCHAWANTLNGIDLEVNATVGSYIYNVSINYCTFHDNVTRGININGVQTYAAAKPAALYGQNAGFHLIGNRVYNNGTNGIHVQDVNSVFICQNLVRNNGSDGIHLEHSGNALVAALNFSDFFIGGNICKSNAGNGILIQGETAAVAELNRFVQASNISVLNTSRGFVADAETRSAFIGGNLGIENTLGGNNISTLEYTHSLDRIETVGEANETARVRMPLPSDQNAPLVFGLTGVAAGVTAALLIGGAGTFTAVPMGAAGSAVKLAVRLTGNPGAGQSFTVSLVVSGVVQSFTCTVTHPDVSMEALQELKVPTGHAWNAGATVGLSVTASAGATTRDVIASLSITTFNNA